MSVRPSSGDGFGAGGEAGGEAGGGRAGGPSRRRLLGWSIAGAAGLTALGAVDPALAAPAAGRRSGAVSRVRGARPAAPANAIALTIDDGPHPVWTPRILEVLRGNGVRATFFVIGVQAKAHPELVRRILAEGHTVGNHSLDHPTPFGAGSAATVAREISAAQAIITAAGGVAPRYFRSPGGDWSPTVLAAAAAQHLTPVGWSVDPRDWTRPGVASIVRTLTGARAGDILLCHDGGGDRSQTVEALRQVLPALRARGRGLAFTSL
ncbi:polysaccharide deacetylase family protein [Frankia sp. Mgl5]|uniref:polysaccharide deacetylase family protein n=1 Tax=Frankia sp. Mgl5 TaxID=2933793 RepID=UPI00200FD988|nr:polysaccharide deacetylase family protein [Frankia sp. Mgl5]MCK9932835.1 polysaccharide deacetylase family protein [Frankia sp. Mgl5]